MALFAIGDLHLALGADKPMDVFSGWDGHMRRLAEGWARVVRPGDDVVLAGDLSWAMKLEDCGEDFAFVHGLAGRKWIIKGNHDYWWATRAQIERYLAAGGFSTLGIIHNSCAFAGGMALCGTRGWMPETGRPHDLKVILREAGRLRESLADAQRRFPDAEKLVFLHYPPVCYGAETVEFTEILHEFGVRRCFYGHLHGHAIRRAVQGDADGITYTLISADALKFEPYRII